MIKVFLYIRIFITKKDNRRKNKSNSNILVKLIYISKKIKNKNIINSETFQLR